MKVRTYLYFQLFIYLATLPVSGYSQMATIKGTVQNALSNSFIKEANIVETISGIGTITNQNGCYRLMLRTGKTQLNISVEGFKPVSTGFILKKDTIINMFLEPLNEIKFRQKSNESNSAMLHEKKK